MEQGVIDVESLAGGIDLQATVESGQSYLWDRDDGEMYQRDGATGGDAWYWTTVRRDGSPAVIRVRQRDGVLEWESTIDAKADLKRLLRLEDNLSAIRKTAPDDDVVQSAYDTFWGMRLVQDPPFGSLISFICSAQMRVARIHSMQQALRDAFGEEVEFDGRTYNAYPTPSALAETTEARLRDLGLGYRAPYVQRTAEMVATGEANPGEAVGLDYEDARESLTRFVGVGDKVADCVLLFSLDYLEAVPLDTWIRSTIEEYYPECERGNYTDTSRAIRTALGGEFAGYTQTYLFHYLRTGSNED
ncbi:DNA-3-methyladenine glycosylase family protein [Haloarcula japonica]|uniref:DNA-(apurinic or apyrimidinic site) lyase n=1 Tax=Haloarcula japonica (strain ATCC 49778 / DSM 6131 / JCM 7785 / NBRC 101032 / NCIMB 13157 / TR-1) TaxID=1227453 RepID=M0LAP7_HALJT|nr:DNA glycosylase [Haloarcula japonica]EMA30661.1 8-oxoguanine DNA glycosylase [Haloarcula japonica DSM 6131]